MARRANIEEALETTARFLQDHGWRCPDDLPALPKLALPFFDGAPLDWNAGQHSLYLLLECDSCIEGRAADAPSQVARNGLEFLDPVRAAESLRITAAINCTAMINRAIVDSIATNFFPRPASTWRIVLVGAEWIDSAEELARIERIAWQLLVPQPTAAQRGQDLSHHGVLFFAEGAVPPLVEERVIRDREALAAWLQTPIGETDHLELRRLRTMRWVEQLIQTIPVSVDNRTSSESVKDTAIAIHRLRDQFKPLGQTHDDEALELLMQSLQQREQRLSANIPRLLQAQWKDTRPSSSAMESAGTAPSTVDFLSMLNSFVHDELASWQQEAAQVDAQLEHQKRKDLLSLGSDIDWAAISRMLGATLNGIDYPEALFPSEWDEWSNGNPILPFSRQGVAQFETACEMESIAATYIRDVFSREREFERQKFAVKKAVDQRVFHHNITSLWMRLYTMSEHIQKPESGLRDELVKLAKSLDR